MNDPSSERFEWRFMALFVVLMLQLVVQPMAYGIALAPLWYDLLMAVLILAVIWSFCYERHERLLALLLGVPTILCSVGAHVFIQTPRQNSQVIGHVFATVFLFSAVLLIIKTIVKQRRITVDGILGAMCGYLILGIAWALLYTILETWYPGAFELQSGEEVERLADGRPRIEVFLYYSFVTLTTVGYGDVIPLNPPTRTCSWLEAMTGQFYMAVVVAGLVGAFIAKTSNRLAGQRIHSDG